jgi:murein DD-endopeptidase MepM/ murein hydrolase activator NlpD
MHLKYLINMCKKDVQLNKCIKKVIFMNCSILKVFILLLLVFLSACSERKDGPSEIVRARPPSPYHIVKKDQTLADIASIYGMKESELITLNNLKEPYTLFEKQRLLVRVLGEKKSKEVLNDGNIVIKELDDDDEKDGKNVALLDSKTGMPADGVTGDVGINTPGLGTPDVGLPSVSNPLSGGSVAAESKIGSDTVIASGGADTFDWPVKGKVITSFGQKLPDGKISDSLRISAPVGTKVKAASGGVVRDAGALLPGYGKMAVVNNGKGRMSVYAYLKDVYVKKGQSITKGQAIGTVGKNGADPMLFFQVREAAAGKKLAAIDPAKLLP